MEYIIKTKKNGEKITVRQLQLKLVGMLEEIDRICKKNNIEYFLAGGSCLGAVRHHGFIPWDDDIDIAMSRVEYQKFMKALEKDLPDEYVYHCYEKSRKYPVTWPAMKIRLKNTYILEMNKLLPNPCKNSDGIFIDVFIYDYMSNNKLLDFPLRFVNTLLMPIIVFFENLMINPIPLKALYRYNAKLYGRLCKNSEYFADDITWTFRKHPFKYRYDDIYPTTEMEFEGKMFPVPGNYKEYLRKNYGETWMTPPPAGQRYAKHTFDINLDSNEPDKDIKIVDPKRYVFGMRIGLILIILALILLRDISFILCGLGIIICSISFYLYMKRI